MATAQVVCIYCARRISNRDLPQADAVLRHYWRHHLGVLKRVDRRQLSYQAPPTRR